jgi:hypothetical protein
MMKAKNILTQGTANEGTLVIVLAMSKNERKFGVLQHGRQRERSSQVWEVGRRQMTRLLVKDELSGLKRDCRNKMLFNDIIPHSRMPKSLTVPSPSCLLKT